MREGCMVSPNEGGHLFHSRDHGNIFIEVGSVGGSDYFALGTQQLTVGGRIPSHRHLHMDEAFYVLDGSGTFTLTEFR